MVSIAGWIAPVATMVAAMMTAANLGARLTGWGFVVFCFGAIGWIAVGLGNGQQNLVLTNGFLLLVNIVGAWRWLGRQTAYDDGGASAAKRSAAKPAPTLFSAGALAGAEVTDCRGASVGTVVDAMLREDTRDLAYVVISDGGAGGLAETLRAIEPDTLIFQQRRVRSRLTRAEIERLPPIRSNDWPDRVPAS